MAVREGKTASGGYLEAATVFDQLAATVDVIPEDVCAVSSEGPDVSDGLLDVERWAAMLRGVAFQSAPKNAEDFVRSFIVIERRDKRN